MTDLPWIEHARPLIGLHEIVGTKHNPIILKMWTAIRAPFSDDETPWCAAFVGSQLESVGIRSTRSAGALSYRNFGKGVSSPCYGAIAVKPRMNARGHVIGGHVTFVVGQDNNGNLICLGGNQNNQVSLATYSRRMFTDFRFPIGPWVPDFKLPIVDISSSVITEA
jgi:uncharacterized protein (TIGR02594 family)